PWIDDCGPAAPPGCTLKLSLLLKRGRKPKKPLPYGSYCATGVSQTLYSSCDFESANGSSCTVTLPHGPVPSRCGPLCLRSTPLSTTTARSVIRSWESSCSPAGSVTWK